MIIYSYYYIYYSIYTIKYLFIYYDNKEGNYFEYINDDNFTDLFRI